MEVKSRQSDVLQNAIQHSDQVLIDNANDPDALDALALAQHLQQALANFPDM